MRRFVKLDTVLWKSLREMGVERQVTALGAVSKWPEAVGPALAKVSCATHLKGSTLWVTAANSAWSQELAMRREEIRKRINGLLGKAVVKEIRIRVDEVKHPITEQVSSSDWSPPFVKRRPGRALAEVVAGLQAAIEAARAKRATAGERVCGRCGERHLGNGELCPACRFSSDV